MYALKDQLNFGKHKGKTVRDAIIGNYKYIQWCLSQIEWFALDEEAKAFLGEVEKSEKESWERWKETWKTVYRKGHIYKDDSDGDVEADPYGYNAWL